MATITLSYNARNSIAASMIDAIRKSGVFKIEEKSEQESPYDPKFVEKIERSKKSKGKSIKTEDLWK
ncbi:MAG: hypothetical protein IJJ77_02760 [Paludibacteraceae bacterium]|nr:hypothetical protein [Paludibacteraceae bacterium]